MNCLFDYFLSILFYFKINEYFFNKIKIVYTIDSHFLKNSLQKYYSCLLLAFDSIIELITGKP